MPDQIELILRLLLAAALAGLLGGERELTEQPAGFRTHILVGVGAALFTIISAHGFQAIVEGIPGEAVRADVTRIASQIVVGIGFLGGGAILKYGASVRGLTTAASLWVTAAVGTAVGVGALLLGSVTTAITLAALVGLRPLRAIIRRHAPGRDEFLIEADRSLDLAVLLDEVQRAGAGVQEMQMTQEPDAQLVRLVLRLSHRAAPDDVASHLAGVEHVRNVDWSR